MKRVLAAVALGGLLLVGTPSLASSAQRNDTHADKGDNAGKGGDRGGDHGGNKGDNNRGDHGNRSDRGDRGDRGDRDHGDRGRHGYDGYYGDRYYYGYPGYYYGEPYDCYYGARGAYNCEPYGGDYYPGYGYGYGYGGSYGRNGDVLIQGHAFNPPEVRVRPGEEVTWTFADREPHTVTADNKSFDSGSRRDGDFRLRFDQPGTYSYHCAIHPDMRGRVLVG
jgi:hypothetical protein